MDNTGLLTLAAGQSITIQRDATLFVLAQATGEPTVELYRHGQEIFSGGNVPAGARLRTEEGMTKAVIRNDTGASIDIDVYFTRGEVDIQVTKTFEVLVKNTVADPVPVTAVGAVFTGDNMGMLSPDTLATVADVAIGAGLQGLLVAAAGVGVKQREVVIKNLSANVADVRIGDINAAAARGHELMPGESITLDTMGAIYGFNNGGGAQSLSVVTNSRS